MKQLFSTSEVARICMTQTHVLVYALSKGRIKEPVRLNGRRAFTEKDVELVKQYFSKGNIYNVSINNSFTQERP